MRPLDDLADAALLRVCDADGVTVGTAFRVTPDGTFLTCHHVVRDLPDDVPVAPPKRPSVSDGPTDAAGGAAPLTARCREEDRFPNLDLALLRCPGSPGEAVPLAADGEVWSSYWTKGFGWQSDALPGAVPAAGAVLSTTAIRYGEDPEYRLDDVLVLAGHSSFDGGLSGAPLFDANDRAVIGVVNTRYAGAAALDGFALRIQTAVRAEPRLAALLAQNRREVPHHGRHLNAPVALDLCRRQCAATLRGLAATGEVVPERYLRRPGVRDALAGFQHSPVPVLALVGPSGVGKTTELAEIARDPGATRPRTPRAGRPRSVRVRRVPRAARPRTPRADRLRGVRAACVFLLGSRLSASTPLAQAVDAELARHAEGHPAVTTNLLLRALDEAGQGILLLIDGLNEIQAPESLDGWLAETADWLRDRPVKAVITSRPEFWDRWRRRIPSDLLYAPHGELDRPAPGDSGSEDRWQYRLADFDPVEAAAAMVLYGLDGRGLRGEDARHPFLLRIYHETAAREKPLVPLRRYQALDLYVGDKCRAVARSLDLRLEIARDALSRIAEALHGREESRIGFAELTKLCSGRPGLDEAFLDEHVLINVPGGCRFAFDQVVEFLQAELFDPSSLVAELVESGDQIGWQSVGVCELALLRLEGTARLAELLDRLLDELDRSLKLYAIIEDELERGMEREALTSGEDVAPVVKLLNLYAVIESVLGQVHEPVALLAQLERLADLFARGRGLNRYWSFRTLLRAIHLPTEPLLAILRHAVRAEDYYGFRQKDWEQLPRVLSDPRDLPILIDRAVCASPEEAFALLVPWLADDRALRGKEATVADVATAILCYRAELAPDFLFDLLADGLPASGGALRILCGRRPDLALGPCERWVATGRPERLELAVKCAAEVLRSSREPDLRDAFLTVVRHAQSIDSPGPGRRQALVVLFRQPESVMEVADEVLSLLHRGDRSIDPGDFHIALKQDPERFVPELLQDVEAYPERADSVFTVVGHVSMDRALEERYLRSAVDAYRAGHLDSYQLALAVEERLYRVGEDDILPYLVEIVEWMVQSKEEDFRRTLGYVLKTPPTGPGERALHEWLRALGLKSS